jgi:peptidoglycan/LPS O-acetylase OafA/YrhL
VFAHNPVPYTVNGSLWSLGLEVRWYAYLGLLSLLGVTARRWLFSSVALAFLAFAAGKACTASPTRSASARCRWCSWPARCWRNGASGCAFPPRHGRAGAGLRAGAGHRAFFPLGGRDRYGSYWFA